MGKSTYHITYLRSNEFVIISISVFIFFLLCVFCFSSFISSFVRCFGHVVDCRYSLTTFLSTAFDFVVWIVLLKSSKHCLCPMLHIMCYKDIWKDNFMCKNVVDIQVSYSITMTWRRWNRRQSVGCTQQKKKRRKTEKKKTLTIRRYFAWIYYTLHIE